MGAIKQSAVWPYVEIVSGILRVNALRSPGLGQMSSLHRQGVLVGIALANALVERAEKYPDGRGIF